MATRTWSNVTIGEGAKTLVMAFKTSISSSEIVALFNHYMDLRLLNDSSVTNLISDYGTISLEGDFCDGNWHLLIIEIQINGDFWIYLDGSILPIVMSASGNGNGTYDMVIGSDDNSISIFGLRVINGVLGISECYENFIHTDLVNNNGNVFFEVA